MGVMSGQAHPPSPSQPDPPPGRDDASLPPPAPGPTTPVAGVRAPTQTELDALSADRRLELLELQQQRHDRDRDRVDAERERRRQGRHQWINSGVLLIGAMLAGGSLLATAATLRTGQDELRTAKEGQVTDRYTKAAEQLGSGKREVRTAAIYALERIAADSPRDRHTVRDVLAAYVREHDPAPSIKPADLPKEPDTDVTAALTVLTRRPTGPPHTPPLDLHSIRIPHGTFTKGADLSHADLSHADLSYAHLPGVGLQGADLRRADLSHANLSGAILYRADLSGADLQIARLVGAYLNRANLSGADLRRADLFGAKGITEGEVRKVATVDGHTRFP